MRNKYYTHLYCKGSQDSACDIDTELTADWQQGSLPVMKTKTVTSSQFWESVFMKLEFGLHNR